MIKSGFIKIMAAIICAVIVFSGCSSNKSGFSSPSGSSGSSENGNAVQEIIAVKKATPAGVQLTCAVPELKFRTIQTGKYGDFTIISSAHPSVKILGSSTSAYSTPQVPVAVFFLAFPYGATADDATIAVTGTGAAKKTGLKLCPVQKPHRDLVNAKDDESFSYDSSVYLKSVTSHKTVSKEKVDSVDNANIWKITVNLMDYDAKNQAGTFFDGLDIDVSFKGDTSYYSVKRVLVDANNGSVSMDAVDEWLEESAPSPNRIRVENETILKSPEYIKAESVIVSMSSARFIIVTHPDFADAANRLAAHKESIGISTRVVLTTSIAPNTLTDALLRDYLIKCYSTWAVRPKWVLLIGDAEFIPTHEDSKYNTWDDIVEGVHNIPNSGDMYYGQLHGSALELPVFGIGRLPVDTLDQADIIVDKIIAYETDPPGGLSITTPPYYYTLTFAAEFQDTDDDHPAADGIAVREFDQTSEHIRDFMLTEDFEVTRIYNAPSRGSDPGEHWPEEWLDGTPLPADLRFPFPWNGNSSHIIAAVNDGTSILYHRDHGAYWGWGTPGFTTTHLGSITITDNKFPVVYSINCASGYFDNETRVGLYGTNSSTVGWAEQFIRNADGAIGVICDTRCSHTGLNNHFAKGLFDATWPEYRFYGTSTSIRKLGDILNHAKGYVKTQAYTEDEIRQEINIYNLLGDPTVEVRSRPPMRFVAEAPVWTEKSVVILPFRVPDPSDFAPFGTPVVAVAVEPQTGTVVGRAIVLSSQIKASNTVSIPISTQKLGKAALLNVVLSGSDVLLTSKQAEFSK